MFVRAAAISSVVAASSITAADPVVRLDRCTVFDREALHAAIQRELVASRLEYDVTLVVECPDAATAQLSIEPAMGLSRTLDLGEVPGDLRVKLIAIAALDLVAAADPARAFGAAGPPAAGTIEPATAEPSPTDTIAEREVPSSPPPSRFALTPRIGVRVFTSRTTPMPHVAIDAELDRLAFGVTATRGTDVQDPIGTLTPYVLTAAGSYRLGCWGDIQLACMRARVEAGIAGVSTQAYTPMVRASDAKAFYAQGGLAIDIEHSFGAVSFLAVAEAAWSRGLVATAEDREPVRLTDFTITTVLGLRWRP